MLYRKISLSIKGDLHPISLMQSLRNHSKQSIARGDLIERYTEGIDDDDKEDLIGERKSVYHVYELNSTLQKHLDLEKSHFRLRTIVVVLIPFFSISLIALFRGSKSIDSIINIER